MQTHVNYLSFAHSNTMFALKIYFSVCDNVSLLSRKMFQLGAISPLNLRPSPLKVDLIASSYQTQVLGHGFIESLMRTAPVMFQIYHRHWSKSSLVKIQKFDSLLLVFC